MVKIVKTKICWLQRITNIKIKSLSKSCLRYVQKIIKVLLLKTLLPKLNILKNNKFLYNEKLLD